MIHSRGLRESGFSAVELLITLFVAAVFLFSGYQVYLAITNDGSEVRQQAIMSNMAYEYLQKYKTIGAITGSCTPISLKSDEVVSDSVIPNTRVTILRSCPVDNSKGIYKISVTLRYENDGLVHQSSFYRHPTRDFNNCPEGFIDVPGNALFGTSDFCVMKYEARDVGGIPMSQPADTPWVGIPQYGATNVAAGKTATSSMLTDGVTATNPYYSMTGNSLQHVTIDLGSPMEIYEVKVWHYYADARKYSGTKTQVSENGTDWFTVFDSGEEGTYVETSSGKSHTFEARNVRYIRDYLYGSSSNTGNHWLEIAAYGPTANSAYSVAKNACDGCKLITEAEWMTIAANVMSVPSNWTTGTVGSGSLYTGHSDGSPGNAIQSSANDSEGYVNTGNTSGTQRRTLTLTNGEVIWDFSGNVYEWTQGVIPGNRQAGLAADSAYAWKEWNDSTMQWGALSASSRPSIMSSIPALNNVNNWVRTNGIGALYSNHNAAVSETTRGYLRGGRWSNGTATGVLSLNFSASNTSQSYIGFRATR